MVFIVGIIVPYVNFLQHFETEVPTIHVLVIELISMVKTIMKQSTKSYAIDSRCTKKLLGLYIEKQKAIHLHLKRWRLVEKY